MSPVNTRRVVRRQVKLACFDCLRSELDRVETAHHAGTLRTLGNWSAGQILQHISKFMRYAIDGFPPGGPPWILKVIAQILFKRKAIEGRPPPAGIKLPEGAAYLLPDDAVSFEDGLGALREQIARIERGEHFSHPSPLFGALTHEQWMKLQLGHATMHLGFLELE